MVMVAIGLSTMFVAISVLLLIRPKPTRYRDPIIRETKKYKNNTITIAIKGEVIPSEEFIDELAAQLRDRGIDTISIIAPPQGPRDVQGVPA